MPDLKKVYETSGGAVRIGQGYYVERRVDEELLEALIESRNIFTITAPRQSGKSSLWIRIQSQLRAHRYNVGTADLRDVGYPGDDNRTVSAWTKKIIYSIARAFKLNITELKQWIAAQEDLSGTGLIKTFIAEYLRNSLKGPIVVCIDEIDMVQPFFPFTDNLFEAIRSLGQSRDELDLSFVLIGLNHPKDLLKTTPTSGFNILGQSIFLRDFNADEETAELWSRNLPIKDDAERIKTGIAIIEQTGGQPFLTASLFEAARKDQIENADQIKLLTDRLTEGAMRGGEWCSSHFEIPKAIIKVWPKAAYPVLEEYRKVRKKPVAAKMLREGIRAALLKTGLVKEVDGLITPKSPIHLTYFDDQWINGLQARTGQSETTGYVTGLDDDPKDRICILSAGGMMSMEPKPDGKIGEPNDTNAFFNRFDELHTIAEIDSFFLTGKDSSDMNPEDWMMIARAIYQKRANGYAGFVVIQGTDTLSYTASAVAYALGDGLTFPVVFVGSQNAPHVVHGDARINLMRAATVATLDIPEVVAVVGDTIHRAVRVQKKDDYRFDGMHSPTFEPLGIISSEVNLKNDLVRSVKKTSQINLINEFSSGIFKIGLYPGLNPNFIMPILENPELEGIIIDTLGIGNVPTGDTSEQNWSLIPFISRATELNIPVLLASQFPVQTNMLKTYKPAEAPLEAGAFTAADMAPPAAVTKFMWVLPQINKLIEGGSLLEVNKLKEVKTWMQTNLLGEVIDENQINV